MVVIRHEQLVNQTVIDQLDELLSTLKAACGRDILISESVSRARELGHDRHFSTRSVFFMRLREVGTAFSGSTLMLDGEVGGRVVGYQIALDAVVIADVESHAVVLVEHFEKETERRSEITFPR